MNKLKMQGKSIWLVCKAEDKDKEYFKTCTDNIISDKIISIEKTVKIKKTSEAITDQNNSNQDKTEAENDIANKYKTVLEQIKKEKGPKPSTLKGLKKRIKKIIPNIAEDNISKVIDLMKNNKVIEVNNKEKLTYKK
jgi:hypothetical protein